MSADIAPAPRRLPADRRSPIVDCRSSRRSQESDGLCSERDPPLRRARASGRIRFSLPWWLVLASSGQAGVAVCGAPCGIREVLGECGGVLGVAAETLQAARVRLRDPRNHQVIQLILQRREMLGGVRGRGSVRMAVAALLLSVRTAACSRAP
jgi:hypothetical protein